MESPGQAKRHPRTNNHGRELSEAETLTGPSKATTPSKAGEARTPAGWRKATTLAGPGRATPPVGAGKATTMAGSNERDDHSGVERSDDHGRVKQRNTPVGLGETTALGWVGRSEDPTTTKARGRAKRRPGGVPGTGVERSEDQAGVRGLGSSEAKARRGSGGAAPRLGSGGWAPRKHHDRGKVCAFRRHRTPEDRAPGAPRTTSTHSRTRRELQVSATMEVPRGRRRRSGGDAK